MRWEALFDDLETQLDAEWDAERRRGAGEDERLRISRLTLRERLLALAADGQAITVSTRSGESVGSVALVGADAVIVAPASGDARLVPFEAITGIDVAADRGTVRRSLLTVPADTLSSRITFGYLARVLARRRAGVRVLGANGGSATGTIDRAGVDHLDLARHDPREPRRADAVRSVRVIPFRAVDAIEVLDGADALP